MPPANFSQTPVPIVLLTDPEQRAALAAARALGKRGWEVHTIGPGRGLAGVSRFVRGHHTIGSLKATPPSELLVAFEDVIRRIRADVVIPVTDMASGLLIGHDARLGARVAGPSADAYHRASDKSGLIAAAQRCGIRTPRQRVFNAPVPAREWEHTAPLFAEPMVVKPARSVVAQQGKALSLSVQFVDAGASLPEVLAEYPPEAYPIMVQERTFGFGVGVFLLRVNGETKLKFGHRRLREKPPAGGVSTYREAVDPPPELIAQCEQLLDLLDYDGAAMIEFKQDAVTGDFVLMEINARLWGSVQLAIDAGLDFPTALAEMALGMPVSAVTNVRAGTRTVWELGELDHALALLRRSRRELNVSEGVAVGTRAALRVLFDHRAGDRPEVFRVSDPLPFAAELLRWFFRR